jgi:hypothetical protein
MWRAAKQFGKFNKDNCQNYFLSILFKLKICEKIPLTLSPLPQGERELKRARSHPSRRKAGEGVKTS